jgi:hypothetical protein
MIRYIDIYEIREDGSEVILCVTSDEIYDSPRYALEPLIADGATNIAARWR